MHRHKDGQRGFEHICWGTRTRVVVKYPASFAARTSRSRRCELCEGNRDSALKLSEASHFPRPKHLVLSSYLPHSLVFLRNNAGEENEGWCRPGQDSLQKFVTRALRRSSARLLLAPPAPSEESWSCSVKSEGIRRSPVPISFTRGIAGIQAQFREGDSTCSPFRKCRLQRRHPEESRARPSPRLRSPRWLYRSGTPRPGGPTWRPASRPQTGSPSHIGMDSATRLSPQP